LWQKAVEGGPVPRVVAQDGDAHVVSGDGVLLRVDPATGATEPVAGMSGRLGPGDVVAAVGGYVAAGSGRSFRFSGPAG
jgi:hypothetical protein